MDEQPIIRHMYVLTGTFQKYLKVILTSGNFRRKHTFKMPPHPTKTRTHYLIIHPITLFISGGFS